jgi:hypothetical protein
MWYWKLIYSIRVLRTVLSPMDYYLIIQKGELNWLSGHHAGACTVQGQYLLQNFFRGA